MASKKLLFFALLVAACHRGASHQSVRNGNVLLITLDTTRADHLGAYGDKDAATPNLDALARDGILFEECITPTAYTFPSHSSIMTGLYPPAHGVRVNGETALSDSQTTLAERLVAKGYRTGAFVGAFVLDGRWGLSQGFQNYDDKFRIGKDQRLDLARVQRPANEVVDAALQWLNHDQSKPFFTWVHLYDPHFPYEPPEPFRSRFASRGPAGLYDGEISFVDSQVGRLLTWLEQSKRKDNTIVVIVGDHGEGLGEHGEGEHGYYIYDYAVRVPLLMRIPGTSGVRVAAQVRTIDIAPTIAELVTDDRNTSVQGQSLMRLINGDEKNGRDAYSESMATRLQYGWSALYSLRTSDYKLIDAPRSELYELKRDPKEIANKLDDLRRVGRDLRERLQTIRRDSERRTPKFEEANIDQETMRKLAALGYLSGGSSRVTAEDKTLADPKDKMHLFESVGYAANLISEEKYKEAAEVLDIVLKDDPEIPQAQILLVSALRQTNQTTRAKQILDRYLQRDPSNTQALIAMAEMLQQEGRADDVIAICKRAVSVDPRNARAYEVMSEVFMRRNDHQAALPFLRKAVELQPKLSRSQLNLAAALIALGSIEEAERLLTDIIKQYPKFPLAHYHLALLRERQGRIADARAEYVSEIANHPNEAVARFNLGSLLLRIRDHAGAEEQFRTLIKTDPTGPKPYLILAQSLVDQPGRLAEAESLARAGLERAKDPELKALAYFVLADVYSREGRRSELQDAVRKGEHFKSLIRS